MKHLIMLLVVSSICFATKYSEKDVRDFGNQLEVGGLKWLAPKTDEVIWQIIDRGTQMLDDQGYSDEAESIRSEYLAFYSGSVTKMYRERHQGDQKEFSAFLTKVWIILFDKLCGNDWSIAEKLHISDLYSINVTVITVFHPCSVVKDEYKRHFAKDDDSRQLFGLVPIVTYWVTDGVCMGFGGGILCGVAANLAERLMGNYLAPILSDKIFVKNCG